MKNKYYDGSEKESNDKKAKTTKKATGHKVVNVLGALAGLAITILTGKQQYDKWKGTQQS